MPKTIKIILLSKLLAQYKPLMKMHIFKTY